LSGEDAVGFVRFRHSDDDFRRQERQKAFLLAFKSAVLRHPGKLGQVAEKARGVFGNALSDQEVASLMLFAKAVGSENIKMGMVPTVPARRYDLRVDKRKLDDVLREHHFVEPFPESVRASR
jgi:anionic cell wall polymer biosynthesis LytR-Cps2A-Psr (LCP) family protein